MCPCGFRVSETVTGTVMWKVISERGSHKTTPLLPGQEKMFFAYRQISTSVSCLINLNSPTPPPSKTRRIGIQKDNWI